ncbi:hypothetical protein ACXYMX_14130 [Sporosarcina sp. CAU 1771]
MLFKKLYVYIIMLGIGCTFLVLANVLDVSDKLKWVFLALAILLNLTTAVVAMRYGLKEMRPK